MFSCFKAVIVYAKGTFIYKTKVIFVILNQITMYKYQAKVLDWVDGDTVVVEIDLGFYVKRTERLRLARIDTPEMRDDVPYQIRLAKHARMVAKKFCPHGSTVTVETFKSKRDMYARYIAEVSFEGRNMSDYLLSEGVGVALS